MRWVLPFSVCIASIGIGCAPPYAVVEQATVAPLEGATSFAVLDVDTTALARGWRSDREVLASKGYVDGSREISRSFAAYLRAQAAREGVAEVHRDPETAHFVIRPRLEHMDPGHVDLVTRLPSRVSLLVSIEDRHGYVLETIRVQSSTDVEIGRVLARETHDRDLRELARGLTAYLADRTRQSPHPASW
jgi:hypothetical protein